MDDSFESITVNLDEGDVEISAEPQHTPVHGTEGTVGVQVDSWRNLWKSLEICHSSLRPCHCQPLNRTPQNLGFSDDAPKPDPSNISQIPAGAKMPPPSPTPLA
jgi:hypothetical protein